MRWQFASGLRPANTLGGPFFSILATRNVVMDHVSVIGFGDGTIDVSDDSHDVTVQWSIFAEGNPTVSHNLLSLVKYST